jgi:hypothetical protein
MQRLRRPTRTRRAGAVQVLFKQWGPLKQVGDFANVINLANLGNAVNLKDRIAPKSLIFPLDPSSSRAFPETPSWCQWRAL